jgi:hypothetical protein
VEISFGKGLWRSLPSGDEMKRLPDDQGPSFVRDLVLPAIPERSGAGGRQRFCLQMASGAMAVLILACGGGGTSTPPPPPAPTIQAFSANPSTVTAGRQTTLKASYSNGQGIVTPGSASLASGYAGAGLYVKEDTTFTLTVTNAAGVAATATTTANVTIPPVGFQSTGNMVVGRNRHTATLLADGRVLFAGGTSSYGYYYASEVYDPASGAFSSVGPTMPITSGQTATRLLDGRVLLAGGGSGSLLDGVEQPLASSLIFNPTAATFSGGPVMGAARSYSAAMLLPNGQVLVAGGLGLLNGNLVRVSSAELYDPATQVFRPTGSMVNARSGFSSGFTTTLLTNGSVLMVGDDSSSTSAELYDPATGTFTSTGSMTALRMNLTATLLGNGKVLVIGRGLAGIGSADLYDPATGTFTALGSFDGIAGSHTATLLSDGTVLLIGGGSDGGSYNGSSAYAWIYDPATGTVRDTGTLAVPRLYPSVALLATGKVLVAGGQTSYTVTAGELYGFAAP